MENNDNKRFFIITIDTEADNQWDNNHKCTTKNTKYLPRFQELAEKFDLKPVWLITYEMANDKDFVKYFKLKQDMNLCEIGMHLHAWNTPPEYKLDKKTNNRSYLIEYPINIMKKKVENLDNLITEKFEKKPISHRAGRWAMNKEYFNILSENGYLIDCSITPHIDWKKNLGETGLPGSNYKYFSELDYYDNNILEVPMTIRKSHTFQIEKITSIKGFLREMQLYIMGRYQWIRPDSGLSLKGIIDVINKCCKNNEYIMFMIHSSELMPGGSPSFKDEESIEELFQVIEKIFKYIKEKGYTGMTLKEYYNLKVGDKNDK